MKDPIDFYKLSAIPSPPDPNDYKVTRLVPLLNTFPVYHSIKYNSVAKNQGDIGSCVPHSISCLKEIIEEKQSGEFRLFSPGFVYANRRNTDFQGEGMVPSQALYNLRHHGIVHIMKNIRVSKTCCQLVGDGISYLPRQNHSVSHLTVRSTTLMNSGRHYSV